MISFAWPWIFLLAPLPLPLLLRYKLLNHRNAKDVIKIPPSVAGALRKVGANGKSAAGSGLLHFLLLAAAWLSLIAAIAQPYKPEAATAQPASGCLLYTSPSPRDS